MCFLPFTYCSYKKTDDDPYTRSKHVAKQLKWYKSCVQTEPVFVSNNSVVTSSEKII